MSESLGVIKLSVMNMFLTSKLVAILAMRN